MKAFPGEKIAAIADVVDQGIALCREGKVWWASRRLADLLGCASVGELVGERLSDRFVDMGEGLPRPDAGAVRCGLRGQIEGCRGLQVRRVSVRSGELWMAGSGEALYSQEPEADISSMSLEQARAEVAGLRAELANQTREREQFLAVLAHELRTPITVIGGYHRLLLSCDSGPLNEAQSRYLTQSAKSCRNLDALVENILDVSPESLSDFDLDIQSTKIESIITSACGSLAPVLEKKCLRIETRIDADAGRVKCDPVKMGQVFSNLLDNSIRFSPRGAQIGIVVRCVSKENSGFVEVSVSDHGLGFDPDQLSRVFEPYVRGAADTSRPGLGLGLWICKRVVEAHGGSIWAENEPGGGCRVQFSVPTALPDIAVDEEKTEND
jgi:signal transduction histidine kinase